MAAKASNARAAARLMEKEGSLPQFSPKRRVVKGRAARRAAAREAAASLVKNPLQSIERLKNRMSLAHGISYLKNSEMLAFVPRAQAVEEVAQRLRALRFQEVDGVNKV